MPPLQQQLCDNLLDGVYFVDNQRRIPDWNRGADELTSSASDIVLKAVAEALAHSLRPEACTSGCSASASLPSPALKFFPDNFLQIPTRIPRQSHHGKLL